MIYHITRAPVYGRIILKGHQKPVENFTQADVDEQRLSYISHSQELGSWSIRDYFTFVVHSKNDRKLTSVSAENDYRFRILISYAFIDPTDLTKFIEQKDLTLTKGSRLTLNSSYLNIHKLEAYCNDILHVEISRPPKYGQIEFLGRGQFKDDENEVEEEIKLVSGTELHLGRHLVYGHDGGLMNHDEFVLQVYGLREKQKKVDKLKITVNVRVVPNEKEEVQVRMKDLKIV